MEEGKLYCVYVKAKAKAKLLTSLSKSDNFWRFAEKVILNAGIDGGSFDAMSGSGGRHGWGCGAGVDVERLLCPDQCFQDEIARWDAGHVGLSVKA